MAHLHLGIDVGTSSSKVLLLSARGAVNATAAAPHPTLTPRPGWSEQHPEDWWNSVRKATRAALRKAQAKPADVIAIGLSGQMHSSVFLDRQQRILRPALLWNDQRTQDECAEITSRAGGAKHLLKLVSNVALTGYQAPKILWLRNHEPGRYRRLRHVLLPKDYINLKLTGQLATDVSDASGTLLFDVTRRAWSTTLMDLLDLDPDWFPPVHESPDIIGELLPEPAKALGLRAGTPVVAGAGDQAAAAVGTGVVKTGIVSATIGTSGVVFAHSDVPVPNHDGILQSFCHAVPGKWCVFGCMLSGGGSLHWAREILYADRLSQARTDADRDAIYTDMIADAAHTPRANDAIVFHPYLTGERCPYQHPYAHGAFIGTTRTDTRGSFVRAVLEGVTLSLGRQLELMRNLKVPMREVRLAGGGARNHWWRQLQADIYGLRCTVANSEEGSALGAALLAAVGARTFKTVPSACRATIRVRHQYRPDYNEPAATAPSATGCAPPTKVSHPSIATMAPPNPDAQLPEHSPPPAQRPLTPADLLPAGPLRRVGQQLHIFDTLDSTSTFLRDHAAELVDGTIAWAEFQTAGRGRLRRQWSAPRGSSILLSLLLFEPADSPLLPLAGLLGSLAACDTISSIPDCEPALRWPNDVVLAGRKVVGVLAESSPIGQRRAVTIGIGINCLQHAGHFPADLANKATSLEIASSQPINRAACAANLLKHLDAWLAPDNDPSTTAELLRHSWQARCIDVGKRVTLLHDQRSFTGTAMDIDPNGDLVVQLDHGGRRHFASATTTRAW